MRIMYYLIRHEYSNYLIIIFRQSHKIKKRFNSLSLTVNVKPQMIFYNQFHRRCNSSMSQSQFHQHDYAMFHIFSRI